MKARDLLLGILGTEHLGQFAHPHAAVGQDMAPLCVGPAQGFGVSSGHVSDVDDAEPEARGQGELPREQVVEHVGRGSDVGLREYRAEDQCGADGHNPVVCGLGPGPGFTLGEGLRQRVRGSMHRRRVIPVFFREKV